MHIHNNSVLHYLYNMAVGLVIYSTARAFKAKAKSSRPRPENPKAKVKAKAKKFGLKSKAKDWHPCKYGYIRDERKCKQIAAAELAEQPL